jgi:hypothetical protein
VIRFFNERSALSTFFSAASAVVRHSVAPSSNGLSFAAFFSDITNRRRNQ